MGGCFEFVIPEECDSRSVNYASTLIMAVACAFSASFFWSPAFLITYITRFGAGTIWDVESHLCTWMCDWSVAQEIEPVTRGGQGLFFPGFSAATAPCSWCGHSKCRPRASAKDPWACCVPGSLQLAPVLAVCSYHLSLLEEHVSAATWLEN